MKLKLFGLVLALALIGAAAHAETSAPGLSKADTDAFDAIAEHHASALTGYQNQALQIVMVWPIDEVKACALEQASVTEMLARKTEELALLRRYEQDGKPVDSLIRDFLRTSRLADQLFWSAADACAAAQSAKDGHATGKPVDAIIWRAVYRDETLLAQHDKVRASYDAAVLSKDRLTELSDLQSLETLLTTQTVPEITGLRDLGAIEPRRAALIARLPALETEQADIDKRDQAEVKPITDPRR